MNSYGPYEVDFKIHVTDGEQSAVVTYGISSGAPITKELVDEALEKSLESIQEQMNDDWRLCTKKEFLNAIIAERTGSDERFAIPGGSEWDDWNEAPLTSSEESLQEN